MRRNIWIPKELDEKVQRYLDGGSLSQLITNLLTKEVTGVTMTTLPKIFPSDRDVYGESTSAGDKIIQRARNTQLNRELEELKVKLDNQPVPTKNRTFEFNDNGKSIKTSNDPEVMKTIPDLKGNIKKAKAIVAKVTKGDKCIHLIFKGGNCRNCPGGIAY